MTRSENHVNRTTEIIRQIEEKKLNINIKINTVVSNINSKELDKIAEYIGTHASIKRWKLMKFYPIRVLAIKNKDLFNISEVNFLNSVKKVKEKKLDVCKISVSDGLSMSKSYFSIYPDGHIRIEKNGEEVCIGNALMDNVSELFDRYIIEKGLHDLRFKDTLIS